ncbi:hypothetical protein GALL_377430 [mine drainage metagenome]|uniref:LysM domain-containing protein n=1 Tax=mine drainage metagenome TaxID=410659 RepID=A0A1J5QA44_9ZZZZ
MTRPRRSTAPLALPLGTIAAAAATMALVGRSADLARLAARPTVDTLVALAASVIGSCVGAWLTGSLLLATSCLVARLVGRSWRRGERAVQRWAPRAVRRALVSAMAAGVGLSLGGVAQAATVDPATADLGWTVTTARTADTAASPPAPSVGTVSEVRRDSTAAPATSVPGGGNHLVRSGDTLWSIAAAHLPPGADDAAIARAWPAWYGANVGTIGGDPNLLKPGQVLHSPRTTSETTDAPSVGGSTS